MRDLASLVSQLRAVPPRCDVPPRFAEEGGGNEGPSERKKTRARWDVAAVADGDLQKRRIHDEGQAKMEQCETKDENEGRNDEEEVLEGDVVVLKVKSCCYPSEREEEETETVAHVFVGSSESCHPKALQRAARSMRVGERALVRWKTEWNGDEGVGGGSAVIDVQLLHRGPGHPLLGNEWEIKTKQEEGEGWRTPSKGCQVRVAYRIQLVVTRKSEINLLDPLRTKEEPIQHDGREATAEKFKGWGLQRNRGESGNFIVSQSSGNDCVCLGDGSLPRPLERLVESMRMQEGATLFIFGESAMETMKWVMRDILDHGGGKCSPRSSTARGDLKDQTHPPQPASPSMEASFATNVLNVAAKRGLIIDAFLEGFIPVRDVTGTGEVVMQQLRTGQGEFPSDCPLEDCDVKLRFVPFSNLDVEGLSQTREKTGMDPSPEVMLDMIEKMEFQEACLGAGELPQGLDMAVHLLLPGEVSKVSCTSKFAKTADEILMQTHHAPEQHPKLEMSWVVELVSFEKPVNWYSAEVPELMQDAQRGREKGNKLFKLGKHHLAKVRYEKTLGKLNGLRGMSEEEAELVSTEKVLCHLNLAACFIQLQEFGSAIQHSTKAIEFDPSCVKGYFRRGQALALLNEYDRAREDYQAAADVDPDCKSDVEAALKKLAVRERAALASARQDFTFAFPTR